MAKGSNRINVLDFVISVLSQHEKELDKNLAKLDRITRRLETENNGRTLEGVPAPQLKPSSAKNGRKEKAKSKAIPQQCGRRVA